MMRKKMTGFPSLLKADEALSMLLEKIDFRELRVERVPLEACLGRYCGEDVRSPVNVPAFDRSAMDGYAVRAEDTFGASPTNPVTLELVGVSHAGMTLDETPKISPGQTVEIYTGGPIPAGADAVVMAENVKKTSDGFIEVYRQVYPFQNVSRVGEDFAEGELVVAKGIRIRPWHIGALASLNITHIPVYVKLRIAVLSTGSELVELGQQPRKGQIINSSKPMLKALITELGCEPVDLGTAEDSIDTVSAMIREGLRTADMVIVTGGTSVGERDIVPEAVNKLGKPGVIFHGVRVRPAKPTGAAVIDGKPVFMLSGFPVSALLGFVLFVEPVVNTFYWRQPQIPCTVRGKLSRRVANPSLSKAFVRVFVRKTDEGYVVEPLMLTGSGLLSTLTKANGILVVPEDVEGFDEGDIVEVHLLKQD